MKNYMLMKKFISFFSFIALAVFAVTFVSCSKDNDEPEQPEPVEKDFIGNVKIAVTDEIFDYCDCVLTLVYDDEEHDIKFEEKHKVTDTNLGNLLENGQSPAGRIVEGSFIYKFEHSKIKAHLTFTVNEEGKKKIEAAGDEDEVHFAVAIKLKSARHEETKITGQSYFLKQLEQSLKDESPLHPYTLEI